MSLPRNRRGSEGYISTSTNSYSTKAALEARRYPYFCLIACKTPKSDGGTTTVTTAACDLARCEWERLLRRPISEVTIYGFGRTFIRKSSESGAEARHESCLRLHADAKLLVPIKCFGQVASIVALQHNFLHADIPTAYSTQDQP